MSQPSVTGGDEMPLRKKLLAAAEQGILHFHNFFSDLFDSHEKTVLAGSKNRKLIKNHKVLQEISEELDRAQSNRLWKNVRHICIDNLNRYAAVVEQNSPAQDDLEVVLQSNGTNPVFEKAKIIELMGHICSLCQSFVSSGDLDAFIPSGLTDVIFILNGLLLDVQEDSIYLASNISKLCIQYWKRKLPKRDEICLNCLIYLLNFVLNSGSTAKGKLSDAISDIYLLREVLPQILFSNIEKCDRIITENIQELMQLMLACVLHPSFLTVNNGRKLISSMMLLNEDTLKAIHKQIIEYLHCKSSHKFADAYGYIYYQSWLLADSDMKEKVEEFCVQDMMFRAIHSHRGKHFTQDSDFSALQSVLQGITCHMGATQVRHMICRLYNPIIWRSFKATNAMVRANSATLLFDAFPFKCEGEHADNEDLLHRQFKAIDDLLVDPCPQVRTIAVCGLCRLFIMFWDSIPAHVIARQVQVMYGKLAFDTSSPEVREAVFRGTRMLLDNACCHPLLKQILPSTESCLNDSNEKVRIAFADMLIACKQTTTVFFYEVCKVDKIVLQLKVDRIPVSKRLAKLLTGSFLPANLQPKDWLARCVNFYSRDSTAARKFYYHVSDRLTGEQAGDFMSAITRYVYYAVLSLLRKGGEELEGDFVDEVDAEKENTPAAEAAVENGELVVGLLETIAIIFPHFEKKVGARCQAAKRGEGDEGEGGGGSKRELREKMKRVMIELPRLVHVCFKQFHDDRTLHVLLRLSSLLHPSSIPVFSTTVIPKLRSLPDSAPPTYYSMLIRCVSGWGWSQQILQLVCDWLEFSMSSTPAAGKKPKITPKSGKRSGKRKKGVQFAAVPNESRPDQALKYLACFLDDDAAVARSCADPATRTTLRATLAHLHKATEELVLRAQGADAAFTSWTTKTLTTALQLQFKLVGQLFFHERDCRQRSGASETVENGDGEDGDEQEIEELAQLRDLITTLRVDVLGCLKTVAQMSQDASMIATTSSSQTGGQMRAILQQMQIAKACCEVAFPACSSLLRCSVPLSDDVIAFMSAFVETGAKLVDFIEPFITLYHDVVEYHILFVWSSSSPNNVYLSPSNTDSPPPLKNEEELVSILNEIVESLMLFSHRNPDSFPQMFRGEVRGRLRDSLHAMFQLSSGLTRRVYAATCNKLLSAALSDLYRRRFASDSDGMGFEDAQGLPQFCAQILAVVCATEPEARYVSVAALPAIFSDHVTLSDRSGLLRSCRCLLGFLAKEGKHPASARTCLDHVTKLSKELLTDPGMKPETVFNLEMSRSF